MQCKVISCCCGYEVTASDHDDVWYFFYATFNVEINGTTSNHKDVSCGKGFQSDTNYCCSQYKENSLYYCHFLRKKLNIISTSKLHSGVLLIFSIICTSLALIFAFILIVYCIRSKEKNYDKTYDQIELN
jgi:hypothetical protein